MLRYVETSLSWLSRSLRTYAYKRIKLKLWLTIEFFFIEHILSNRWSDNSERELFRCWIFLYGWVVGDFCMLLGKPMRDRQAETVSGTHDKRLLVTTAIHVIREVVVAVSYVLWLKWQNKMASNPRIVYSTVLQCTRLSTRCSLHPFVHLSQVANCFHPSTIQCFICIIYTDCRG